MESRFDHLVRPHLLSLKPYASARHEFQGEASVFLDANENPFDNGLNRYPDPLQSTLKQKLADLRGIASENIFLGNGSDEAIDLIIRLFCEPGQDHILICPPTYGMYQVSAQISNVQVESIPMQAGFQLDLPAVITALNNNPKVVFLCSPNNPSGNVIPHNDIVAVLESHQGITVVDEAYIDFVPEATMQGYLSRFPGLILLQTFSKAWGLAGVRLGIALAHPKIISWFNKIKPPYNVNTLTQQQVLAAFEDYELKLRRVQTIIDEKKWLTSQLSTCQQVTKVFASDANFLLVQFKEPKQMYSLLKSNGVIVRDRSNQWLCHGCLRITIGTPDENKRLIELLKKDQHG